MQKRIGTGFLAMLLLTAVSFRACAEALNGAPAILRPPYGADVFIGAALAAEVGRPLTLPEAPEVQETPAPPEAPETPAQPAQQVPAAAEAVTPMPWEAPEPTPEPAPSPAPSPAPLRFTASDAQRVRIAGGCTYETDVAALLDAPLPADFSGDGPKVLIVHTHGSEAYTPEPGWIYEPSDTLRTEDPDYNVLRVGRALAERLNAAGVETLHDETIFDYPTYSGAYTRTLEAIERWLEAYPSIRMVVDVHRDAASDESGQPVGTAVALADGGCARLMFVVGTDEGGMPHPDWRGNLATAVKLQALLCRAAPTLCRDIDLRQERFNQHATPCSLLVEVGSAGDTLAEALRAADYLADALAALLTAAP